jgi:enediyne biosynthesis protein E4
MGVATGDLDGDGRPDLAAWAFDGPAALLRNASCGGRVLTVQLQDRHGQPAVGAHIRATISGRVLVRDQVAGGSYLSACEPKLYFGLGSEAHIDRLDVEWPWGSVETWNNLAAGRLHHLDAGKGASSSTLESQSR